MFLITLLNITFDFFMNKKVLDKPVNYYLFIYDLYDAVCSNV